MPSVNLCLPLRIESELNRSMSLTLSTAVVKKALVRYFNIERLAFLCPELQITMVALLIQKSIVINRHEIGRRTP
jgi:hypothetical protein